METGAGIEERVQGQGGKGQEAGVEERAKGQGRKEQG